MLIEIVSWAKFNNPRKDIRSTTWFRFQNNFFIDPDFCDLPHDEKWVFPYLCSVASAKMSGKFEVSESLVCKILNIDVSAFERAINHLVDRGIIEIAAARKRNVRVPRASRISVTSTARNERTNSDVTRTASAAAPQGPEELVLGAPDEPRAGDVWNSYVAAYRARHGAEPVRNAKQMGMCAQLVKRLGGDAAVAVVAFYLQHPNAYYAGKGHALGPCLADCETLHTQMLKGQFITRESASHADKNAAQRQAFENVARRLAAKKEGTDDGAQ